MKTKNHTTLILSLILATLVVLYPHKKEPFVGLVAKTVPATVSIAVDVTYVPKGSTEPVKGQFGGAGAYISPNGHILTCAHLFGTKYTGVHVTELGGFTINADVLYVDKYRDLALLKVIRKTPHYLPLGHYEELKVGQQVIAIGAPLGFDFSVSQGIISQLDRFELSMTNTIQTDAAINHGNSGGPMVNMQGEIIGVNTMMVSPTEGNVGLGFAQSIKEIRSFLARWKGLKV